MKHVSITRIIGVSVGFVASFLSICFPPWISISYGHEFMGYQLIFRSFDDAVIDFRLLAVEMVLFWSMAAVIFFSEKIFVRR